MLFHLQHFFHAALLLASCALLTGTAPYFACLLACLLLCLLLCLNRLFYACPARFFFSAIQLRVLTVAFLHSPNGDLSRSLYTTKLVGWLIQWSVSTFVHWWRTSLVALLSYWRWSYQEMTKLEQMETPYHAISKQIKLKRTARRHGKQLEFFFLSPRIPAFCINFLLKWLIRETSVACMILRTISLFALPRSLSFAPSLAPLPNCGLKSYEIDAFNS